MLWCYDIKVISDKSYIIILLVLDFELFFEIYFVSVMIIFMC